MPPRRCDACGVNVPEKNWLHHVNGKQHQWVRFYGTENRHYAAVGPFRLDGLNTHMRAHKVPQRVADCSRRARELALQQLALQSSHVDFGPAKNKFLPEVICPLLLQHAADPSSSLESLPCADVAVQATPAHIAVIAALLTHNFMAGAAASRSELTSVQVCPTPLPHVIGASPSNNYIDELAMSAALAALAASLVRPRRYGLVVRLHLARALTLRHRIDLVIRHLCKALATAKSLSQLRLSLTSVDFRASDAEALIDAAQRGWRERQWAVLQGTHAARESPLRTLPSALVLHILELVAAEGRTRVVVECASGTYRSAELAPAPALESAALPAPPLQLAPPPLLPVPPPVPPAGGGGADLDAIAAMLL